MSTITAATVQPGQLLEFYALKVKETRVLESGRYKGMVLVTYVAPYDDSRNDWRVYPPEYNARF